MLLWEFNTRKSPTFVGILFLSIGCSNLVFRMFYPSVMYSISAEPFGGHVSETVKKIVRLGPTLNIHSPAPAMSKRGASKKAPASKLPPRRVRAQSSETGYPGRAIPPAVVPEQPQRRITRANAVSQAYPTSGEVVINLKYKVIHLL